MISFMNNLKKYRKERKLSQSELAAELGISQNVLGKYERGYMTPPAEMIDKFSFAFHTSAREIFPRLNPEITYRSPRELKNLGNKNYSTDPRTTFDEEGLERALNAVFNSLKPNEERVLKFYFGFWSTKNPPTFQEIGRIIGVSKQRAKQIEEKAITKLRQKSISNLLKPYYFSE